MEEIEGGIILNEEDQCNDCTYCVGTNSCILLSALLCRAVQINPKGFVVRNCPFYEKRERHLRVVK